MLTPKVISDLGTSSIVSEAYDMCSSVFTSLAVKSNRASESTAYSRSIWIEHDILRWMETNYPERMTHFPRIHAVWNWVEGSQIRTSLAMERLGPNVWETLVVRESLSLDQVRLIGAQVLQALAWLHEANVIHTDVKPENLLSTLDGRIKLCDFGTAIHLEKPHYHRLSDVVGSDYYRAPEVVLKGKISCKSDIWSIACVLYELATGMPMFPAKGDNVFRMQVLAIGKPSRKCCCELVAGSWKKAVQCVRALGDPKDWRMEELSAYSSGSLFFGGKVMNELEWLSFSTLLGKMLSMWPSKRPSAVEALEHSFFSREYVGSSSHEKTVGT